MEPMNATHASFFSGVGGLDLGLERAGWRTVSFSEIDPYASAVLAERWPGVPNLGDIVGVAGRAGDGQGAERPWGPSRSGVHGGRNGRSGGDDWQHATLWTGGFPCQDLSVAGKRRGLAGSRSGLAFSFLDLVGRHRPRFVLLENVPGLLSSHGGKDFGTLLAALVELGYGVGYRVLDARYFGVPQRRRRVFILGDSTGGRAGAERAAEVLSVGSRCRWHPPTGIEAGPDAADRARPGVDIARAVTGTSGKRHDDDTDTLVSLVGPSPDPDRMRAPDGLAGWAHDRDGLADTLNSGGNSGGFRTEPGAHLVSVYVKGKRAQTDQNDETWGDGGVMPTLNAFDVGDVRTTAAIIGAPAQDDPLLPLGLDSHRYRCCGNGVVADVAEFIGRRLLDAIEASEDGRVA